MPCINKKSSALQKEYPDGGDYVQVRWRNQDGYARRANVVKAMARALHMGTGPIQKIEGGPQNWSSTGPGMHWRPWGALRIEDRMSL